MAAAETLAIVSAVVSVVCAVIALKSVYDVKAAGTTRRRRKPHRPSVTVAAVEGLARRGSMNGSREYAFLLTISNNSELAVTMTRIDLRVAYRTREDLCGATDLPLDVNPPLSPYHASHAPLTLPLEMGAHDSSNHWVYFRTRGGAIPHDSRIDGYTVIVSSAEGLRVAADASLPAVMQIEGASA